MKTCTIDGCKSKHRAKGLCTIHYAQEHRRNNKVVRQGWTVNDNDPDDFWQFVKAELGINA